MLYAICISANLGGATFNSSQMYCAFCTMLNASQPTHWGPRYLDHSVSKNWVATKRGPEVGFLLSENPQVPIYSAMINNWAKKGQGHSTQPISCPNLGTPPKMNGIFWEFFPMSDPPVPLPPFWEPLVKKEKKKITNLGYFLGDFRVF